MKRGPKKKAFAFLLFIFVFVCFLFVFEFQKMESLVRLCGQYRQSLNHALEHWRGEHSRPNAAFVIPQKRRSQAVRLTLNECVRTQCKIFYFFVLFCF